MSAARGRSGAERMPVLYTSHGGPGLPDDPIWPGELAQWGADLPRPAAVLMVSAHWEEAPLTLGATTTMPLVYDFWGFPERYYQVRYPAPGAPELADGVRKLLRGPGMQVYDAPDRGLDHGAYVPLTQMYPGADIPVLQMSMPSLDPEQLMEIGSKLAPLRDEGVLIVGSGHFTHNLQAVNSANRVTPAMAEFDDWGQAALDAGDVDSLLDFKRKAPAADYAHPREEHFVPLAVALGAAADDLHTQKSAIKGFWLGVSKRSVQFG